MNPVAFIWHDVCLSWTGILAGLGALAGAAALGAFCLARGRSLRPLALYLPAAILFSLILGRLCHWYCHPLQYAGFRAAMTGYAAGGFALPGAFAGALLAALLLRLGELLDDLPGFLDALAPAGALAIAVGRLGSFFDVSDRGNFLLTGGSLARFPFAVAETGPGGETQWRFATFLWQAGAALAIFLLLTVLFFRLRRGGDVFLLGLALYGAAEAVLESTRYDGGSLRTNGFVSLAQLGCALCLLLPAALYALRARRAGSPWRRRLLSEAVFLAAGYLGGYMEYYVQRHGNEYAFAYSVMAGCFFAMFLAVWALYRQSRAPAPIPTAPAAQAAALSEVST